MFNKNMIYQCSNVDISGGGGIETYVASLLNYRLPDMSDRLITSLKDVDLSQFKLLHIHNQALLVELRGECSLKCPSIYTLHNHSSYCPSGTKYLKVRGVCCDRNMSTLACTWGHLVDSCGSRRPQNIIRNLQDSHRELETLKKLRIPVIANSDYVRGQLIKNGLSPEQSVTVRYGISIPKITTEPLSFETHKNQRILFAGRIVPDKGLDWLLKAFTQTDQRIQLDIAGDGWERPRMEKLAARLGVSDRVTWYGWCSPEKLDKLYQQCFALVFPSVWPEPAGLVTIEAYAHYRPVIASAVGGIPEHVRDGETGFLVPSNDVKKLAIAITNLSKDYQKSRLMGEQGYAWFIEEFTITTHLKRLKEIYENTITNFHAQDKTFK
jgi:glycosyltransferase involved in cell wall biosynthesis